MDSKKFKTGEIIVLTSGEYSGYEIFSVCEVRKDFLLSGLSKLFPHRRSDGFPQWLIDNGYVERLAYRELNFGTYGRFRLEELDVTYDRD